MKKFKIFFKAALILIVLAAEFGCSNSRNDNEIDTGEISMQEEPLIKEHYSKFLRDTSFWEEAFSKDYTSDEFLEGNVYGGIIPHHLLPKDITGSYFKLLAKHCDPEVIVVIGPNHFERGYAMLSSKYPYKTLFGYLEPELSIINKMEEQGIVKINEEVFEEEHSISAEVSYIKKFFPESKFVPIVLRVNIREEDLTAISDFLNENLPEKSLVLASVDFSHYISADAAQFHDYKSIADIESFNFFEIQNIEVDSPNSIFTLLKYLESRGFMDMVKFKNTNSGYYLNKNDLEETTSYLWAYFAAGQPKVRDLKTTMIFPNMKDSADKVIETLKGDEDRFFRGVDEIKYYSAIPKEKLSDESRKFFNKYNVLYFQEESPINDADYILGKVEGDIGREFRFEL